ncbi:MAG: M48 family metalloprotease [Actinobacteria bacterium]|nr:M48 family metalloprotease [Actinomycetota bacterium]
MVFVILLSGGLLLALPGLAHRLARRVPPEHWARASAAALVVGAVMVQLTALLVAAPTVLRAVGVHALAAACERLLGPMTPGGDVVGWTAAALSVALPVLVGRRIATAVRTRRQLEVEPWLGDHQPWEGHDLVVLPSDEVVAFSVGGPSSQIVVSRRLVAALSPPQLQAVLRHEAAHLAHRHQRFLLVANALDVRLPYVLGPLRRSTASLRVALERWADEAAAGAEPHARDDLRDALFTTVTAAVNSTVPAFSTADTVLERLRALEAPPVRLVPARHALLSSPALALTVLGVVALAFWMGDIQVVLAMAGRCPA